MSAIIEALKPKKAKKKGGAGTSEGVKPPASKEPAPETPVTPATGAATPQVVEEEGVGKSKGPVEEVIAKRARQLAKKLQRFRAYAAQSPETLNADQRSAIATLPVLESAYNELQELIKPGGPVEVAELNESAKLRAARDEAVKSAESVAASRVSEYQDKLVTPLSLFLRLYTLLHPARPSDHEHLTFGHLVLPSALQDEVQATDVLRVGRMYEDLIGGGESAKAVLAELVRGSTGEDEENDHVHHLLFLLSQPEQSTSFPSSSPPSESVPETGPETIPEDAELATSTGDIHVPTEVVPPTSLPASRRESEFGVPNGHATELSSTNDEAGVGGVTEPKSGYGGGSGGGAGGALNFLQEDELQGVSDESFEMVPSMASHETSGLQPPISAPVIGPQPVAAEPATTSSFNWADDHDDELPPPVSTLPSQPKVDEEVIGPAPTQESQPAVALVQENEATLPQAAEAVDAPSAVESAAAPAATAPLVPAALAQEPSPQIRKGGQGRGRGGRPPREGGREGGGGRKPSQGPRDGRSAGAGAGQSVQHTAQAAENGPKVLVDEDGFELKVRRTPPVTRGGRGGRGGPGASGGERGRGAGRGRGGARGGARTGSGSGERAGQEGGAGAAPKSKPLFKPIVAAPVGTVPSQ
ncbi:hypothetical protein JCM24511_00650 [Saitozyma sp. JCM 24511]|nr:hypothetical protein JCM24511_00650 [Saitozyma sp. JCM 24511]